MGRGYDRLLGYMIGRGARGTYDRLPSYMIGWGGDMIGYRVI
ncbi:hypothetical protein [Sporosarcina sp. FA15]